MTECRWLVSGDRDGKLRISHLPKDAASGAWHIAAYCLGHAAGITCASFACAAAHSRELLVSGSLDGCVMLWQHQTGTCLSTLALGTPRLPAADCAHAAAPDGQEAADSSITLPPDVTDQHLAQPASVLSNIVGTTLEAQQAGAAEDSHLPGVDGMTDDQALRHSDAFIVPGAGAPF